MDDIIENLFTNSDNILETLRNIKIEYLNAGLSSSEVKHSDIIEFINQHKQSIINASLNDIQLIDDLLLENGVIDKTKESNINREYFEEIIQNIKNKKFDSKTVLFYLNIIGFYNLYNSIYSEKEIESILDNNIYSIIKNDVLISQNGDLAPLDDEKVKLTNKLISWSNRCGNNILPEIFNLELLKERLKTLKDFQIRNNDSMFITELAELIKTCEYAITVRDSVIIPSVEEINHINSIYEQYEKINHQLLIDSLKRGDALLVHFVRDNKVDYQLVGSDIIDMSDSNDNSYDEKQDSFFINNYIEFIKKSVEEITKKEFDITNPTVREIVKRYLDKYNEIINYYPLERLPIKIRENYNLFYYIREANDRLSCSLCSKQEIKSHLDRKVGLILKPKTSAAIISTGIGYAPTSNFYDFRNDSVPFSKILEQIIDPKSVNETCVHASECEVVGVVLLSNDEKSRRRAEELAKVYNVEVISIYKTNNNIIQ